MTTDITELAQLRGRTVYYPYYLVECDCGKIYPSRELSGGEPMGDSGDYSDCYCPHCGEGEGHFAECTDPETAWKAQQDKIDALVEALEKAQAGEKQWREVVDAFCADDADWHKLTNSNNELIALLSQALCKQADRIAELESRAVTVGNLQESSYRAGLTAGWNLGLANNNDGFNKCLAAHAAGIKVEDE
ncbi:hypothetical protein [Klebsiella pneumoniae]|uniref:hypothetical protein n=1 Tax=Klebsiella pneumoniae TaxID=573 RepID=UPI000B953BCE|nr:hypothetical protein [Klebsiella pneumoniae]MCQ8322382.1 hypothetical protein [Klebsiella pneumoniae]OYM09553.1 hypothetical protein CI755_07150 [Klebsiella pneumoniae subsp. pneumoniae]HBR2411214.1 hypothetical protein [Klebsiella pneumoniae]HBR2430617.1 hypothetical protein [Klebsiella pneumoniae]HBU1528831.1 hypothetical protein [Klebsiella pneumoniae]